VISLATVSCSSRKPVGNVAVPDSTIISLPGSEWRLVDLAGTPAIPDSKATLAFPEAGRVAGNGSCNRFTGSLAISGDTLKIGALASTRMACMANNVSAQEDSYLKALGAAEVIDRNELSGPAKPLARERWAGGIDSVGSTTLANLLSMTKYGGAIAACGLAAGMDLPASVAPFILRGVCLLGIDSVMCPIEQRKIAWSRLASDLDPGKLTEITQEIGLDGVIDAGARILAGQVRGRIVVKIV